MGWVEKGIRDFNKYEKLGSERQDDVLKVTSRLLHSCKITACPGVSLLGDVEGGGGRNIGNGAGKGIKSYRNG